ncbi:MAG TPA: hypothetical protein VMH39_01560, partial [Gemmatimonadaceae bacterium]|nr:hypothetical protein [Gemmatimonadaceae bacterium]
PVPAESPFASHAVPVVDTGRADSLLDAAGWKRGRDGVRTRGGLTLAFDLLTVGSGDNGIEQLIQSDLGRRGIRMNIRPLELGAFLTRARAPAKTFDALFTGIPGDVSLAFLSAMFESKQSGSALDYAAFHTRELDSLFAAARVAGTLRSRRDAWLGVQAALARTLPVVWLYHARGVQGVSARLTGVRMDLRGELVTLAQWDASERPGARGR